MSAPEPHWELMEAEFRNRLIARPHDDEVKRSFAIFLGQYGHQLKARGDLSGAERALREAVSFSPTLANAWGNLGGVLRLLGRSDEALLAFRESQRLGVRAPEIENAANGALVDVGRIEDALAGTRRLVAAHPEFAPGHEALAHLLWEHGEALAPGEDPLLSIRTIAHARRKDVRLSMQLVRLLLMFGQPESALAIIQPLRDSESGNHVLDWFAAEALMGMGDLQRAALAYEMAWRGLRDRGDFLNSYIHHAFRCRDIERAQQLASHAVGLDPGNQEAWGHLGTAWRLLGDEREYWLHDYERLVTVVAVEPPKGFDDMDEFLAALSRRLHQIHLARRAPINQSVRGGSQTSGLLFGRDDVLISAAQAVLGHAVERWIATLPDDVRHPFLARKRTGVHFVGSWSVSLSSSGRHANHLHPMGWASSAFYVSLPRTAVETDADSRDGWIQFGSPLEKLGLDLPPRRVIRPRAGYLALFPSYTWHGTVPFKSNDSRLTIAFDMQPRTSY